MAPDIFVLRKFIAPEIVFGEGALRLSGQNTSRFNARRILLVSDEGVREAGWTSEVEKSLIESGLSFITFDGVTPNPKDHEVMKGADLYLAEECDVIVAVGGGSAIDCAKAIGIVATNGRNVLEFEGVDEVEIPGPPMICIPTTAGSSADISQFDIITSTQRMVKIAIVSRTMVPDIALIDPVTTLTMSRELTAATGMDALVHAIEAYVSNASSPITDLNALEAIKLITRHLPAAVNDLGNLVHRKEMMLGSLLAGLAFSNASLGLVHSMAHALGGLLDMPHGDCNAILLEHVVNFNFPYASNRYRQIGRAMGLDIDGSECDRQKLTSGLREFAKKVGIKMTLGEMGLKKTEIPDLAEKAINDPCLVTNPVQPDRLQIEGIYEQSL